MLVKQPTGLPPTSYVSFELYVPLSSERIIKYLLIIIINDSGSDLNYFMTGVVWLASIDCRYQRQITTVH